MRFVTIGAGIFLLFFLIGIQEVRAQNSVGAYLGADVGHSNTFGGVEARLGFAAIPLRFAPSFEVSFTEGGHKWQLNGNALYLLGGTRAFLSPYLGTGLAVVQDSGGGDLSAGLNILGGAVLGFGPLRPFAQARVTVAGETALALKAGVLIRAR